VVAEGLGDLLAHLLDRIERVIGSWNTIVICTPKKCLTFSAARARTSLPS